MVHLTRASRELYRRTPDECFETLPELWQHCNREREASSERWHRPESLEVQALEGQITLGLKDESPHFLNDWSFHQLCRLAGVNRETINRLTPPTACQALRETMPSSKKPLQILETDNRYRSLHGVAYTRLWNTELLEVVNEFASDFQPPPKAFGGSTGLYCGEQDMFAFLIDPTGWTEINGDEFAPGFFVWNSEVGRRSLGVQTFWYQAICQNHIVWDACQVVEFTRKHTANVRDGLSEIRRIIERLVTQRNERRDGFVRVLEKAMVETLCTDDETAIKELLKFGIPKQMAKDAAEIAMATTGRFTIFAMIDAITRLTQSVKFIGDRTAMEAKVSALLSLAA